MRQKWPRLLSSQLIYPFSLPFNPSPVLVSLCAIPLFSVARRKSKNVGKNAKPGTWRPALESAEMYPAMLQVSIGAAIGPIDGLSIGAAPYNLCFFLVDLLFLV